MGFFDYVFIQHALVAVVLASMVCGLVGTLIVINRLAFLAGGVAHCAYGGVGLAVVFALPMMPILLIFTSICSLMMGFLTAHHKARTDVIIGALWALGMACGILLLDFRHADNSDLMSYLFGSILAVSRHDLWIMAGVVVVIFALVVRYYRDFLIVSFEPEYARTRQISITLISILLLLITAWGTVVLIRVVGMILTIALLTIPPYFGIRYARKLWQMMLVSACCALVFCFCGIVAAYYLNLTASAVIIIIAIVALGSSMGIDGLMQHGRQGLAGKH